MSGTRITRTSCTSLPNVIPKLGTNEESGSSVSVAIRYRLYGRGLIPVRSCPFIAAMYRYPSGILWTLALDLVFRLRNLGHTAVLPQR